MGPGFDERDRVMEEIKASVWRLAEHNDPQLYATDKPDRAEERYAVLLDDLDRLSERALAVTRAANALHAAVRWAESRIDGALGFAGERLRPVSADFYRDVLEEVRAELADALRAAQEDTP